MTFSLWSYPRRDEPRESCDVAIIGGGIVGCGAAYWLSKRAGLKVALIEKGKLGAGASGRNAGFVLRGIRSYYNQTVDTYGRDTARFLFHLGEESQRHIREFIDACGDRFDYEPCGSFLLACSAEEMQDLSQSAELMKADGFVIEYLKEDPLGRGYFGALYNPGDFGLHPVKLLRALLQTSAARLLEEEPVTGIEAGANGLSLATSKRILDCQKVLFATNAYTPLLQPFFKDRIKPARGQILVTEPLKRVVLEKLCYANYGWEYFRQLRDRRILLGGCRQLHIEQETGYADVVTDGVQGSLQAYLNERFPEAAHAAIDYRWSGIMGFSADGLPMVGEVPEMPGAFIAAACNGHGMGYGMALSRLLVQAAIDGKACGVFDIQRLMRQPALPA